MFAVDAGHVVASLIFGNEDLALWALLPKTEVLLEVYVAVALVSDVHTL